MSSLPITPLDAVLIGVMLVSAVLAMIRGFIREVLSIAAWVLAAAAAAYAFFKLVPLVNSSAFFNSEIFTKLAVTGGAFILTLIVVSIITVRFSDMVLDSRIGPLDRTLGFLFGLGRGLLIVAIAFLFFDWLVPPRTQPAWVTGAKSISLLKGTDEWLQSLLPDDWRELLFSKLKSKGKPDEESEPTRAPRGSLEVPARQLSKTRLL
jgi:membrane protein required for colicin V production